MSKLSKPRRTKGLPLSTTISAKAPSRNAKRLRSCRVFEASKQIWLSDCQHCTPKSASSNTNSKRRPCEFNVLSNLKRALPSDRLPTPCSQFRSFLQLYWRIWGLAILCELTVSAESSAMP